MKIFKFIGNMLNHVESFTDSVAHTAISSSDTISAYAETQHQVAVQQRDYTLAEAKAESEVSLYELKIRLDDIKSGKPAEVDTSKSIDEILASM